MHVKRLIAEQAPRCVAIDPLSALARVGGGTAARAVARRLIYLCRNAGITVLFTSPLEGIDPQLETTTLHVSKAVSDSWIQISYALLDGERNRELSVIKSRRTKHSTQLRELIFSDAGHYAGRSIRRGGEVLMGTLRMEKENALHVGRAPPPRVAETPTGRDGRVKQNHRPQRTGQREHMSSASTWPMARPTRCARWPISMRSAASIFPKAIASRSSMS